MQKVVVIFSILLIFIHSLAGQALGPQPNADYTVALHADGSVYTWRNNDFGQLGDNTTTPKNTSIRVLNGAYSGTTYIGDSLSNKIIAVAAGSHHSLALAEDGRVYAWGSNYDGQLGDNTTISKRTPVRVIKGEYSGTTYLGDSSSNKIIAVAAGRDHSLAIAEDGNVYAWGNNYFGSLGDNTTTTRKTPIRVLKGAYSGTTYLGDNSSNKIIAVEAGSDHSLALAEDGSVYAWGYNYHGQLGDSTRTNRYTPVRVLKGAYSGTTYLGDNSSNKIIAVALGSAYSLALAEDGSVYAWGYNFDWLLGDNTDTTRKTPVRVLKGAYSGTTYLGDNPSNKIIAIAAGWYHSIALAEDGSLYTWGLNCCGLLGDNTTTQRKTPVRVLKGEYSGTTYLGDNLSNKIIAFALGQFHSIAIAADGSVYTWGDNRSGQLGDNSNICRYTPVKVKGIGDEGDLSLPVEGQIPLAFGLQKVYPNPFNPSVTLNYSLPEDGQVSLKVYNLRGQLVETILSTYALKGSYTLTWSPQNLSSGVYLITLQSGLKISKQKLVYIK